MKFNKKEKEEILNMSKDASKTSNVKPIIEWFKNKFTLKIEEDEDFSAFLVDDYHHDDLK